MAFSSLAVGAVRPPFATGTELLARVCLVLALAEQYDLGALVAAACVATAGGRCSSRGP